jgi:purine nucleosidase
MRSFLIDTDTASDDAVALVMALRHPNVHVEAITVVAGNVPVAQGVQNALYTVALCGRQTPVYAGMAQPLLRPLETAQNVHGLDGMGDLGLPLRGRQPASGHAVQAIVDAAHRCANQLTLVTLGPLTNLAAALRMDPSIAGLIQRCVIMGGLGQGYGNVTPVAEYNIWVDPEAAQIVFQSGLPLVMVGWDISRHYAVIDAAEAAELRSLDTPLARFCIDIQRHVAQFGLQTTRIAGFDLPDPIAMAVALDPAVATLTRRLPIAIECQSALCRGQTVVDHLLMTGQPANVDVVLEVSRQRFLRILRNAIGASCDV